MQSNRGLSAIFQDLAAPAPSSIHSGCFFRIEGRTCSERSLPPKNQCGACVQLELFLSGRVLVSKVQSSKLAECWWGAFAHNLFRIAVGLRVQALHLCLRHC